MFENRSEPLLPRTHFLLRMLRSALLGIGLIAIGLVIGALGYWYFEDLNGVDALLNASMILTGMGPVTQMHTHAGKLFATAYAVFSGVAFPTTIGIMMAPAVHRFLHKLHLDEQDDEEDEKNEAAKQSNS
jgi:hypothetical protein